jgi:cell wall-associated NlpC family hydrolase
MSNLQEILESWEGTPYLAGHRIKRQGVDCVQFVAGVLEEWFGYSIPCPRLSATCAYHDESFAKPTAVALLKGVPSDRVFEMEPGDIVVSQGGKGVKRPHHVLIVSEDPRVLFHSTNDVGVCRTPAHLWTVHKIYRPRNKPWPNQSSG